MADSLPAAGSSWVTFAGAVSTVITVAELWADLTEDGLVVVFRDDSGHVWAMALAMWQATMKPAGPGNAPSAH